MVIPHLFPSTPVPPLQVFRPAQGDPQAWVRSVAPLSITTPSGSKTSACRGWSLQNTEEETREPGHYQGGSVFNGGSWPRKS